jgi:chaperonin GroEL
MQRKKLISGTDLHKIANGIDKMAQAVGSTLGPKGRTVLIQDDYGMVKSTKDGVTVAKNIILEDDIENLGATVVREICEKTNEIAGDGTTTALVLANAIIKLGLEVLKQNPEINQTVFKREIEASAEQVYVLIDETSIPLDLSNTDMLKAVATISANNDPELGNLLSHAFQSVGSEGEISIVEGKNFETNFELIDGYRFNRGFTSPSFITNTKNKKAELENVIIVVVGDKLTSIDDFFEFLERTKANVLNEDLKKPYLLICEDIDEKVSQLLIYNKLKGNLNIAIVKGPGINFDRRDLLLDIAKMTNAQIIGKEYGLDFKEATSEVYGFAMDVEIDKDQTTLMGHGGKDSETLKKHIEDVTFQYEKMDEGFLKDKVKERIARMSGGIGVIYAGGSTPLEIFEKIDRLEDAKNALKSAIEEGVVPGGGSMLLVARRYLNAGDIKKGGYVLAESLAAPLMTMMVNSGASQPNIKELLNMVNRTPGSGVNMLTEKYCENMIESNIVDSAKVVKTALRNAVSVAALFLTTQYAIVNSNYMTE